MRLSPAQRRRALAIFLAGMLVSLATSAAADNPLPENRWEPGLLPALGQDPDVGFKFGAFGQLARFADGDRPYAWRLQALAAASVRQGASGLEMPYREAFLRLDRPHLWVDPLRLSLQFGYLRTTNLGYFGVGNNPPVQALWDGLAPGSDEYVRARHTYQLDGTMPSARMTARYRLAPGWEVMADVLVQWIRIATYSGSLLEQDVNAPAGSHLPLGQGLQPRLALGLIHDTRDHETVATRGQYDDVSIRCGSGTGGGDAFCAANVTLRGYWPLLGEHLHFAGRIVGDMQVGSPPLLELTRYGGIEGGNGPGGCRGIRGVPQGMLAGKTKLFANLELRSFFLPFTVRGQRFKLGAAAFFDAGRVWSNTLTSDPLRDGSAGVHWGAGGGPRLRWGDSLLIRADVAYSPLGAQLGSVPAFYLSVDLLM